MNFLAPTIPALTVPELMPICSPSAVPWRWLNCRRMTCISSANSTARRAWSSPRDREAADRHIALAHRLHLLDAMSARPPRRTSRTSSFSIAAVSSAGRASASAENPTRLAKSTVTWWMLSAIRSSPSLSRRTAGPGRMFSSSASFSRFFCSMTSVCRRIP